MTATIIILVGFAVVALVAAIWALVRRADRARTEALQQASIAAGLTFEATGDVDQMRALGDLPLLRQGHSKRIRNGMSGRQGASEVKLFDYQYTTGGGEHSHPWRQTVALYPGGGRSLPEFVLAPEHLFHKIGQLLGYQDIDFESNPGFSSRYLLRGRDETAIRAAFRPETLAFLEQEQGWTVEVHAGTVAIYRAGKRVKPEELGTFLQESYSVLRALTAS